jgi:hypothetical protein
MKMELAQLPEEVRTSIEQLSAGIEAALASDPETPHTTAVSISSIAEDQADSPNPTLTGGGIRAPQRPPFDFDEGAVRKLHRAALESGKRLLHTIIISAERSGSEQAWRARAKLVTRPEYAKLRTARTPLDEQIKVELTTLAKDAARVSFGRDNYGAPTRLVRKDGDGVKDLSPTPSLLQLFSQVEKLYRDAGLVPVVLHWTLRGKDVDFRDYFE